MSLLPRLALFLAAVPLAGASLGGVVVNAKTGEAVGRIPVTLSTPGPDPSDAVAITDVNGAFLFRNLPAGRYLLSTDSRRFLAIPYGAQQPGRPGQILVLGAAENRSDILLKIIPGGSIRGTVRDGEGDPLGGAQVALLVRSYERGKPGWSHTGYTESGQAGDFQFAHLPAGTYYAAAWKRDAAALRTRPNVNAAAPPPAEVYGIQFYPLADRISAARAIRVEAGSEVGDIDFRLPYRPKVQVNIRVSGIPEDAAGQAVSLHLTSWDTPDVGWTQYAAVASVDHPVFYFFDLVPGLYRLVASLSGPEEGYRGVRNVEITGAQEEIGVALQPGVNLSGTIRVEGDRTPGSKPLCVSLVAGDGLPWPAGALKACADLDGKFRIPAVPPGIWDIDVRPVPEGGYIKSMRLGDEDVLTEDMDIRADSRGPLNIRLSTRGGRVYGEAKAKGEGHEPAITVVLAPEGRFRRVWSFYRTADADSEGKFEITGVRPGDYRLYAFEDFDPESLQNPDSLQRYSGRGTAVHVEEGGEARITLEPIAAAGGAE